jgi:hypothetical protein
MPLQQAFPATDYTPAEGVHRNQLNLFTI